MIVSCSPIYFCQVFLRVINLPHLRTGSVSFFTAAQSTDGLLCARFSFLVRRQATRVCSFESCMCLPDLALYYYEDICHRGSSESLFLDTPGSLSLMRAQQAVC